MAILGKKRVEILIYDFEKPRRVTFFVSKLVQASWL